VKQTLEVKNRGYGFLVPIGKMLTPHEEKNDVRTFDARRRAESSNSRTLRYGRVVLNRQMMFPRRTNQHARRDPSRRRTREKVMAT
jgi:hypothetical protein